MGDRHSGGETGQRAAERARGVALDDDQVRTAGEQSTNRCRNALDVGVRVLVAGAVEPRRRKVGKLIVGGIEPGVLSGQDQRREYPALGQGPGNRVELDRIGSGADDQPHVRGLQPTP
jgi:hypothetical protein